MLVGIDIGTQSLKAIVTTPALEVVGEASVGYAANYPRAGWAEQDPADWERALGHAVAAALAAADCPARSVGGLGICGQLDGCVPVNADNEPLGPCLIWSDRRAQSALAGVTDERLSELTGIVADASHMAAKIAWLKREGVPGGPPARYHQPVSYLVARVTGESVCDEALASTTMLLGLESRRWEPELLEAFGIDATELPRLAHAQECAGLLSDAGARMSGLPAGVPVAVGTGDDFSNPLGAGVTEPGRVVCTLGTAEVVGALHEAPVIDRDGLVETHRYLGEHFFLENPGWFSGGAVSWLTGLLGFDDVASFEAAAHGCGPGAEHLTFLPAMTGAMAPEWVPDARGAYYGIAPHHARGHFARALLEGCAFAMRDVVDRLQRLGVRCEALHLLGGGAQSPLWAQIRADVTGLPVEVPDRLDTSPLGAALLASVAAGASASVEAASATITTSVQRVEPNAHAMPATQAAYERYRLLFDALRPLYEVSE